MKKFLEPIQRYFDGLKSDPVEHVKKSPVFWVLGVLFLAWLIIEVPRLQVNGTTLSDPEKRFNAENEARKTILQGLGGGFFFISAYFTWRNLQVSEKTRQVAEDKQVTERFVKAAEMLADKDRLEVRVAGIYALERIARDSEDDHWTVMEVLTLLIKDRTASRSPDPEQGVVFPFPKDLQVALTVIGRRDVKKDGGLLDLSGANLSGAYLAATNFSDANLSGANLSGAYLMRGDFVGADLQNADLSGTDLIGVNFGSALLSCALLRGADLRDANLSKSYLYLTDFSGANLSGTNLRSAMGTTLEQVRGAKNWEEAIYDLDFAEKLGLDRDEQIRKAKVWDEMWDEIQLMCGKASRN